MGFFLMKLTYIWYIQTNKQTTNSIPFTYPNINTMYCEIEVLEIWQVSSSFIHKHTNLSWELIIFKHLHCFLMLTSENLNHDSMFSQKLEETVMSVNRLFSYYFRCFFVLFCFTLHLVLLIISHGGIQMFFFLGKYKGK